MPDTSSNTLMRFTILGCGSSPGTPRIGGDWGNCDPNNAKNRRRRASFLVQRIGPNGVTTIVIDTGPDFREQMISADVSTADAVFYTHHHADHIHGIDDLRGFALNRRQRVDVYADQLTSQRLKEGFGYCFKTPSGSQYPPILNLHRIEPGAEIFVNGEGGAITALPVEQTHGSITSMGFRFGNVAYCCDVSAFPDDSVKQLQGLDMLIIDALQYKTHPSHFSLEQSLEQIERLAPKRAILTHMHIPLDYETVMQETPEHVEPGYDGLVFEISN